MHRRYRREKQSKMMGFRSRKKFETFEAKITSSRNKMTYKTQKVNAQLSSAQLSSAQLSSAQLSFIPYAPLRG